MTKENPNVRTHALHELILFHYFNFTIAETIHYPKFLFLPRQLNKFYVGTTDYDLYVLYCVRAQLR